MAAKPAPVSVGVIPSATTGHLLFIERADGGLALPGGYHEELEDTATTLTREIFEEMDLHLHRHKWRLFHSAATPCNKLILFSYYDEAVEMPRNFRANEEVLRVISAPWNTPLVFSLHEDAARKWATQQGQQAQPLRPPRLMAALQPYCPPRTVT